MDLSILEQTPRSRSLYTQLCFCYSVADGVSRTAIVETLTSGLQRLSISFPWLAGQVVQHGASEDKTATFKIVPYESLPRLVVKDLMTDDLAPTMEALRKAKFPFRMLKEDLICPRMTLAGGPGETYSDPAPVLLLQANFIRGGLLLAIVACHGAMDIVGQVHMIRLLSKACRDEPFSAEEVMNGNRDRGNLFPLLRNWKPEPKPDAQMPRPNTVHPNSEDHLVSSDPTLLIWAYFAFSPSSLKALKDQARLSLTTSLGFVSTDDAVCALIWQSIARARLARLDPATDSTFTRTVDMRRHWNIPNSFPGNVVTKTTNTSTLQITVDETLGTVASQLRSKLDPGTLKHGMQVSATSMAHKSDRPAASPTDQSRIIIMSSWSKVDCYDLDFGLGLGRPTSVRRPQFEPIEGVVYLLPKAPDGEIVAGLCLRDDDMEKLTVDDEFMKYAEYIR